MGIREFARQVKATYIIEDLVQLLGVHDEVGVAYHVVDGIRLDSRDGVSQCQVMLAKPAPALWGPGLRVYVKESQG